MNTCYDARRPVYAGGRSVNAREAQQGGRPTRRINIDVEAGQRRRPPCVYKGRPTERETG